MERDDYQKEKRMFVRSPLALAIIFTVIKRSYLNSEMNKETDNFPHMVKERSGGITINVGQGGLSMVTDQELEESDVIRIDMPLTETFLSAPTLAQVKWVINLGNNYQVGLAYLF